MEILTGDTPDISDYAYFEFYDMVLYWHGVDDKSSPKIRIWMGLAQSCGSALTYFILTGRGKFITCITVQNSTSTEVKKP